jgi:hypothetical protein
MMSNKWRSNLRDAILLDPLLLALELEAMGLDAIVVYDPISGLRVMRGSMQPIVERLLSGQPANPSPPKKQEAKSGVSLPRAQTNQHDAEAWMAPLDIKYGPFDFLKVVHDSLFNDPNVRVGVICLFVDRYLPFSERQDSPERQISLVIQKAAMKVWSQNVKSQVGSRLILVFDVEGQVPQELNTLFPFARSLLVPPPTIEDRDAFFRDFYQLFDNGNEAPVNLSKDADQRKLAAQLSDGLKMQDLFSLAILSHSEHLGISPKQLPLLLSRFKFGTRENAWANVSTSALLEAAQRLTVRVKGQQEIINEIVPVLIRAKLGMTDLAGKVTSAKPRGVFFFVGPTGVGKTELSKAIAELIFGDEQSLLRFDMSEYSEEHQQARLVGAPPGYVGFDQGGQLTNAISEKPFSVVLFDEIEKAHGRILDKFLQILDDGRLTDGMGKTVYFTESIIIFTSNLGSRSPVAGSNDGKVGLPVPSNSRGIASTSGNCNYLRGLEYPELCDHFREAVKHFFVEKLGRPEILNRIGEENILVFRFLTDDGAKIEILEQQIKNMQLVLQERHHVKIYCTQAFKKLLMVHQSGFDRNGARGVRNLLNRFVLNHLAPDLLVRGDQLRGKTLRIDYFVDAAQIASEPFNVSNLNYTWIDQ